MNILLIVFLPLLAAVIAGLGNRALGNVAAKAVTTGALFVACALSWPIFFSYLSGTATATVVPVFDWRSEEHTSELQSLMRISYAVFCLKKTNTIITKHQK